MPSMNICLQWQFTTFRRLAEIGTEVYFLRNQLFEVHIRL